MRIRYSLLIIVISLVALYLNGNVLFDKINELRSKNSADFSNFTTNEDKPFANHENYANAASAFMNKEYGLAIEELTEELKQYPNHAQAYFLLGKLHEEGEPGKGPYYKKMIENFEKYIELKPKGKRTEYAKLKLAQYYVRVGLTQQSVLMLNKAELYLVSLDQNNNDVKMALGAIYLNKQNYDKAIAEFEKSANLSPIDLKLKYNSLGLAYIKTKSYAKAEKLLEIAVKIDPSDKYAHNNLGFVYAQQGKLSDAKRQFHRALEIDSAYINADKNLRWVEVETNRVIKHGEIPRR